MIKLIIACIASMLVVVSPSAGGDLSGLHSATFAFPLTVSDGAGGYQLLQIGIDPTGTDGIDAVLGETERPPVPPAGVFDARLIGDDISVEGLGQGVISDFREGDVSFSGTHIHELKYQVGAGSTITIQWDLPVWVTGVLQDFFGGAVVNVVMDGTGSHDISSPGVLSKLKLTITYHPPLPVQVVDFRHSMDPCGGITLSWKTVSEVSNFGFTVQRRVNDQAEYIDAADGFLPGRGTSLELQTYCYSDRSATTPGTYWYRLKQQDLDGTVHFLRSLMVNVIATGTEATAPRVFHLAQNYPNPFNPSTQVQFSVESGMWARVVIYNMLGTEVATLFDGPAEPGRIYVATFTASALASGTYICRLIADKRVAGRKMLLMR